MKFPSQTEPHLRSSYCYLQMCYCQTRQRGLALTSTHDGGRVTARGRGAGRGRGGHLLGRHQDRAQAHWGGGRPNWGLRTENLTILLKYIIKKLSSYFVLSLLWLTRSLLQNSRRFPRSELSLGSGPEGHPELLADPAGESGEEVGERDWPEELVYTNSFMRSEHPGSVILTGCWCLGWCPSWE